MPFRESDHITYAKNPLDSVVCELRFPTILRIASEPPAAFQEKIRADYPLFARRQPPLGVPTELAKLVGQMSQVGTSVSVFTSTDEKWSISLTPESFALTAGNYQSWREFKKRLDHAVQAMCDVYEPAFYTRLGLRYKNAIFRSDYEFQRSEPWANLIESHIAGELAEPRVAPHVKAAVRNTIIDLDGRIGQVRLIHGLGENESRNEECYIIDADFFVESRVEVLNAFSVLEEFNRRAENLFRWCITDRLHQAMGPGPSQSTRGHSESTRPVDAHKSGARPPR
jgi:uncharacterized protein (TIGR04255 family)